MALPSVIVYDTNADALSRRVDAVRAIAGERTVVGVTSRSAVLLLAESAPESAPILVDLFSTDRVVLDRPGERLIRRLMRNPATTHVRATAWSAQSTVDVIAGVRDAGGAGFISATLDRDDEREQLRRVLAGESVWPADLAASGSREPASWEQWFAGHFALPWEGWIEPTLVRLASGRERRAMATELVDQGAARSNGHASSRMRVVARAVAGEHRNSPVAVAAAASLALSQIAAQRALVERPGTTVSLEHGAHTIQTAPSLVRAAGLTLAETDEVLAMHELISGKRLSDRSSPGAPAADEVRNERRWAAGRRALERGAGKDDLDRVAAGILAQLDEALSALDDARQDELYHPEGRAAAALRLLQPGEIGAVPETERHDGTVRWRGLDASTLALADDLDVAELHALSESVDAVVRRRRN